MTTAPALVPKGPSELETAAMARREHFLGRVLATNLRLGELRNQDTPKALELRRLAKMYSDMAAVAEATLTELRGEPAAARQQEPVG